MNILVCIKQILDPEISPRDFEVDQRERRAVRGGANLVTNIFCENALETALQLREAGGGEITAVCFGPASAEESLRKALALKVDHAFRVDSSEVERPNSNSAALAIAQAIPKMGDFDVIMAGREAGDWGEGRTAGLLAEHLALPFVAMVDQIHMSPAEGSTQIELHRQTDFGTEVVQASMPLVTSITNHDGNVPRIPKTRDIMLAHRKELTTLSLDDLGLSAEQVNQEGAKTAVVDLFIPERKTQCEFIEGDSPAEKLAAFSEKISAVLRSI